MSKAAKVVSDLQWVDEKLIRPFTVLLDAMKAAAEAQAEVQGTEQVLAQLTEQHVALITQVNAKRDELQTLEREETVRLRAKRDSLEQEHQTRVDSLTREWEQLQAQHQVNVAAMEKQERETATNLERVEREYASAHKKLEDAFHVRKTALAEEIATLERTVQTLHDQKAKFLDEVGHTVKHP